MTDLATGDPSRESASAAVAAEAVMSSAELDPTSISSQALSSILSAAIQELVDLTSATLNNIAISEQDKEKILKEIADNGFQIKQRLDDDGIVNASVANMAGFLPLLAAEAVRLARTGVPSSATDASESIMNSPESPAFASPEPTYSVAPTYADVPMSMYAEQAVPMAAAEQIPFFAAEQTYTAQPILADVPVPMCMAA